MPSTFDFCLPTGAAAIDGEAVLLDDGISDFNALHSGKSNGESQL